MHATKIIDSEFPENNIWRFHDGDEDGQMDIALPASVTDSTTAIEFYETQLENPPAAPEPVVIVYPADLWRRTTDAEADAIDAAMNAQPIRIRRLFLTAQTYQSDDPLWPLLTGAASALFGEARAAELLAPSA